MNRKNVQKTALTTSAVLAGMALGVSVNQNGAHADTVATSTAATSATTTDQQLANMQSVHAATESAAAASNAAVMSEATTSANSQIADLNNQIQTRQASDAVMQQASQASAIASVNQAATSATAAENASYSQAVASQTAANDAALKSAQSTIVTEQQKNQETAQENADYQNQAGNLDSEHNATLNKLDQDLKNNTDGTNAAIQKEISRQKADQQGAIDQAAKNFDNQISAADTEVGKAQQTVNADQDVVNAKDAANKAAQQAVKNAQDKLSGAQEALKKAETNQPVVNTIDAPAEYINIWKTYYETKKPGTWTLSQQQFPELYAQLQKAEQEAKKNNVYKEDPAAKQIKVTLNDNGTLSHDDIIFATQYAASLINPIREAIGTNPYKITNASIDVAQDVENGYRKDNWNAWTNAHDMKLLDQVANNWGTDIVTESWAGDGSFGSISYDGDNNTWTHNYTNLTRDDLQRGIYNAVEALLFECAEGNSSNGHTTDLLGVRIGKNAKSSSVIGSDLLGVGFDYGKGAEAASQFNVGGFHFNSISDATSPHIQYLASHNYDVKAANPNSKVNQPGYKDQIAIPSANKDEQIKQLQATVATDTQALNDAKAKASTTASELKSAQDKLASDQAKLSQAQAKVIELRTNKENTLKAMATDPMQSPQVKQLQAKLEQARVEHDNGVKYEESQFAAKSQDLKTKHEAKLAAIAAQPTSLSELQSQLQAKLDTLKAQHEAKLKQITDDANTKIEKIKSQKISDPEIDKLNAQIAQIKSDLAKKQQELDNNYQALKTKNQAEYDALANKLNPSTKALANGSTQQVFTSRSGKVAYVVPSQKSIATNSVKTNSNSDSNELLSKESNNDTNHLPQTGNKSSLAMILLGAAAAMFGFGLVGKKRMY
ncbi:SEC10/PgrA surface exclusion domain-containing protein [Limosilactobacillus reuteri]|uniref:SEC10/PgrA surface exclusion domain-containing protein n=1 Tax=Limosilactobacillus reuteri TaxID=1598 RepID=UPI001E40FE6B|nr:SEC10/PgrA surface exclusion domain-containing protein [Limosilactobacillus reuteri]MCC4396075.1 SEC10/PgrA surface exclusion domain-containing protein [Limosilactobacillus reuteri]MCC4401710.1 SEC10/PgrA surface exclusion domain-containing protein [Limosilactobacillus reuteri]